MSSSRLELIVGFLVILLFAAFSYYAFDNRGAVKGSKYTINAVFNDASGIEIGSDVKIAGVTIGKVVNFKLNNSQFDAFVIMEVSENLKLPWDSSARIMSAGLLGEKFIAITPGVEEELIEIGGVIQFTQSTLSFEEMLSKLLFGLAKDKKDKKEDENK